MSLPLLLNIILLVLSCYSTIMISRGKLSWKTAKNIQTGILILEFALLVLNLFYGNWLIAVLWGMILFTNLYSMGIFR